MLEAQFCELKKPLCSSTSLSLFGILPGGALVHLDPVLVFSDPQLVIQDGPGEFSLEFVESLLLHGSSRPDALRMPAKGLPHPVFAHSEES
ncbi:MAG: hypothetical protein Q9218_003604 [Villophora microphyllina]